MNENKLVETIVEEVLKQLQSIIHYKAKKRVLVIHHFNSQSIKMVKVLSDFFRVSEIDKADLQSNPQLFDVDFVIFFDTDQTLLAKAALGIIDTPESKLLSDFVLLDVKVYLVPSQSLTRVLEGNKEREQNKPYVQLFKKYVQVLQSFGIFIESFENILSTERKFSTHHVNSKTDFSEQLLSAAFIQEWKKNMITVSNHTIITPLAQDIAKQNGVKIVVSDN